VTQTPQPVPPRHPSQSARSEGLWLACILGWLFALPAAWEVWLASGQLFSAESDVAIVLSDSIWSTPLGRDLVLFGLAQLLLHTGFGLCCWILARISGFAWPGVGISRRLWVLAWYFLGAFWVLLVHADLFPRTHLGSRYLPLADRELLGIQLATLSSVLLACAFGTTIVMAMARAWNGRRPLRPAVRTGVLATVFLLLAALAASFIATHTRPDETPRHPHVILLGIDSLRPEINVEPDSESLMPALERFLEPAVVFDDAITPLPRTYPAWVSVLTGRHPHSTGAVVNLLPREMVDTTGSLPELFRARGYRTIYATDEVRFSNIDDSYGFDTTIIPPIGAADFLIGVLSDMPLSNLVTNTALGRWLLPHAHANRGVAKLYDPDTFVARLDAGLHFRDPTFLALHLTLPHWPYFWRDASPPRDDAHSRLAHAYTTAVRRTDGQFTRIIDLLRARGALNNAIVVVFSDHGEALGMEEDLPFADPASPSPPAYPTGHGTSVLSPTQYRVLLAWRTFGNTPFGTLQPGHSSAPVSLEDIAPTLAEELNLPAPPVSDGISMAGLLRRAPGAEQAFAERIRFTETEFNPPGFEPGATPNPEQFRAAVSNYRLNAGTGRLELTAEAARTTVLHNRQYAALSGDALLAALPNPSGEYRYLAVNRSKHESRPVQQSPDPDSDPVLAALWIALHNRFPQLDPTHKHSQ
jgi:hypothetical protein